MALIIPPGFLHAVYELKFDFDPEVMVTTCGHQIVNPTSLEPSDMADALFAFFASNMMNLVVNTYDLVGVTVYVGNDGPTPNVGVSTATAVPGAITGDALPQNTALLVRKRTDLAGRRGRGRMYLPGVSRGPIGGDGKVDATWRAAAQLDVDNWLASLGTTSDTDAFPPVVLHRAEGIGTEPLPTPVVNLVLDDRVATQRQRLRK